MIFIINASISEKTQYAAYPIFTFAIIVVIWPIIVAWLWTKSGWLQNQLTVGTIDYGYTITVYIFAGAMSMIAAAFTGRRVGRFSRLQGVPVFQMEHHVFYYIGALLTIIGIFSLNTDFNAPKQAFANSWIAGSASSIVALKLLTIFSLDLASHFTAVYQGFIAGMVLISSASRCEAWEAALFGMLAGLVFSLGVKFSKWLQYDDTLNVIPTFFYPALIGGILPGFIDTIYGVFWGGTNGNNLASQVVAVVVVTGWATFWGIIIFGALRIFGLLQLSDEIQIAGLHQAIFNQKGFYVPPNKNEEEMDIDAAKY